MQKLGPRVLNTTVSGPLLPFSCPEESSHDSPDSYSLGQLNENALFNKMTDSGINIGYFGGQSATSSTTTPNIKQMSSHF